MGVLGLEISDCLWTNVFEKHKGYVVIQIIHHLHWTTS